MNFTAQFQDIAQTDFGFEDYLILLMVGWYGPIISTFLKLKNIFNQEGVKSLRLGEDYLNSILAQRGVGLIISRSLDFLSRLQRVVSRGSNTPFYNQRSCLYQRGLPVAVLICFWLIQGPIRLLFQLQYITKTMSIVIKSDQLNVLIYRYFQQCNLGHSAYTLFNQASLEQSLSQYKFDVKPGHLISLMERALIFSQIQSHVTINDYEQCKQPFGLLKSHVCKITQKIKQERQVLIEDLNERVFATMRRTSSVHNTLQPNRDFQQIIYEQRSANFFDKLYFKIAECEQLTLKVSKGESVKQKYFCAYDKETNTMTIINKKDQFLNTIGVVPCRQQVKVFEVIDDLLIQVYEGNYCEVVQLTKNGPGQVFCFKLGLINQCKSIKTNKKFKQIVAFQTQDEYCIINLLKKSQIQMGIGKFEWISSFDYLLLQPKNKIVRRCSLKPQSNQSVQQFICTLNNPTKIKISISQLYFSVESISQNAAMVYNLDQSEPIYIFDFKDSDGMNGMVDSSDEAEQLQKLQQVMWGTSNGTDTFILLTDLSIKTFEIELNNFSKIIEISAYDSEVKQVELLRKNEQQMYVVGLGVQNMLCYDVSLGKIERVQYGQGTQSKKLLQLDQNEIVGVVLENTLFLLQSHDVEPLFL